MVGFDRRGGGITKYFALRYVILMTTVWVANTCFSENAWRGVGFCVLGAPGRDHSVGEGR